jgi:hypothetical protein
MPIRTTIRLEERLLAEAKEHAARQNRTLTSLIEESLRLAISRPDSLVRHKKVNLPVSRLGGGTMPGVDLSNSAELLDLLEGRH